MKLKHVVAALLMLVALGVGAGEMRTWKNNVGGSLEAEFVREKSGTVYLRTADGKVIKIKKSSLSEEDQKLATELASPFKGSTAVKEEAEPAKADNALYELFKTRLRTHRDKKASTDSLRGKIIGIYFSAHWCGPCQTFTPKLVDFHNEMKEQGKPFEVVFVSSDGSSTKMLDYVEDMGMPWLLVPYGNDVGKKLKKKFKVTGIPRLVIIDDKGNVLSDNAVGTVSSQGTKAYDQWKSKAQ